MTRQSATLDLSGKLTLKVGTPFEETDPGSDPSIVRPGPSDSLVDGTPFEATGEDSNPDPPIVTEEFPDSGTVDRFLTPTSTQSQIDAIQAGEIVEFAPGNYGDKNLNGLSGKNNVYAFCRATIDLNGDFGFKWVGSPAHFQHVHDGVCYDHPFAWNHGGSTTLRGFRVRGFSPNPKSGDDHRGSGVIRPGSGTTNCKWWDMEISHSRESAIMPTGTNHAMKRVAGHTLGRYMWGAQVGNGFTADIIFPHNIATASVQAMGLIPEQASSDEGVCKMPGTIGAEIRDVHMWDVNGMGVWWDGAGEDGIVDWVWARNVSRNVVNLEIDFGPYEISNIYAEDSCNASQDGSDVIRAIVLWPLTPHVYVHDVVGVRCGNGVTTHNRNHNVLSTGASLNHPHSDFHTGLGVRDSLVENCDFSDIEGGSGSKANRYNAGWAGGSFPCPQGDGNIQFEIPVWQNNIYSPNAEFRAGNDIGFGLSKWQNTYGMS